MARRIVDVATGPAQILSGEQAVYQLCSKDRSPRGTSATRARVGVRIGIGSEIGCGRSAGPSPSESRCCWPQMLVEKCDHALGIVGRKDWSNELTEIKDNGCVLLGAVQI